MLVTILVTIAVLNLSLGGAVVRKEIAYDFGTILSNGSLSHHNATKPPHNNTSTRLSSGDFPICTGMDGPLAPFCLPEDGADVLVEMTYYVTWDSDFYPLNATITIEMRYSEGPEGTSAFTSDKTDNSYGYIPLRMRKEWLQDKISNNLTLYIIELDPALDRRASARQGPTITLHPKPVNHYKPPPPASFNRRALYIGLPVSLAAVMIIVAGLFFGMRGSRRIGLGNVMGARESGYGIGKSKHQRLRNDRKQSTDATESSILKKYTE